MSSSTRLLFPLKDGVTRIGRNGDVRPLAFSIVVDHCSIEIKALENGGNDVSMLLKAGLGKVWHNGNLLSTGSDVKLKALDRIVIGDCMTMPGGATTPAVNTDGSAIKILTAEEVFAEHKHGLSSSGSHRTTLRSASSMSTLVLLWHPVSTKGCMS